MAKPNNTLQAPPEPAEHDEDVVGRPAGLPSPEALDAGIETSDVSVNGVVKAGVALLIFIVASSLVVTGLQWLVAGNLGDLSPPQGAVAPAPNPEAVPEDVTRRVFGVRQYGEARDQWMARLEHYTYLDEEQSRVSIPVETAMERLLSEGFFESRPASDEFVDRNRETPSDSSGGWRMERTREWLTSPTDE